VNVPDSPAAILVAVHGLPGNPAQLHPAGGVIDTNVVFPGVASVNVPFVIADEPVFVTTCVYVMLFPACTGLGEAAFVTDKFGPAPPTIVVTVAVLLEMIGSMTEELTAAVLLIAVPFATPLFTLTTSVKILDDSPARFTSVQTTVPPLPTFGT